MLVMEQKAAAGGTAAHIHPINVLTNNVPCGHMRAPGKPQVVFAVESLMDMIAREMGLDPYEFRLRNVLQEGDASPVGEKWRNIRAGDTLRKAAGAARWLGQSQREAVHGPGNGHTRPSPGNRRVHGQGFDG